MSTVTGHAPLPETVSGDLFGHPRGLTYLFGTEMWERFSYYGMRALLVLYMIKHALQPEQAQNIIGFSTLKSGLEALFGPLGIQPLSSQIYGLYTGLVYFMPILGGLLADRVLGQRRTVVIGAALMALGHFMMAFERLFLLALFVLILGNGAFKPNISTQVGTLYAPGDPRRDRAFSIFYVGINIGAFFSPLVCGTLGEEFGWHYGFAAAGVGMTIGLLIYLYATRTLPPDVRSRVRAAGPKQPLGRDEWRAIIAIVILALPVTFFWATYEQQGNTLSLWADEYTDRTINLLVWRGEIPVTWFQAFNPFMIFAFTPVVLALWRMQAERGREPSSVTKMAYGCFGVTLANLIMVAAAAHAGDGKASWLWLFAYFAVITVGELYISPTSLSLVTKVAPARTVSLMMGVWLATSFTGNFAAGYLGSFWSGMEKGSFFLMIAAVSGIAGLVILCFVRPLRPILKS
ncbi:peptide MFS transporter [Rhodoplanes sp. Z2-YC6860]|uniref:peptide MFS transporter n=1 Tax=Rhodoplanes sp. Z2-YC6860 TaxID=674703 RepID=UPI001F1C6238|nr:peptide MFS transporter [Rhodoplanes sp. Z2-YC6860]